METVRHNRLVKLSKPVRLQSAGAQQGRSGVLSTAGFSSECGGVWLDWAGLLSPLLRGIRHREAAFLSVSSRLSDIKSACITGFFGHFRLGPTEMAKTRPECPVAHPPPLRFLQWRFMRIRLPYMQKGQSARRGPHLCSTFICQGCAL